MKRIYELLSVRISYLFVLGSAMLIPINTWAQTTPTVTTSNGCTMVAKTLKSLLQYPVCIINRYVLPLLVVIAFCAFFFGLVRYMFNLDNEAKREEMRYFIMWSVVAIFIIVSISGILYLMQNTLRLPQ